MNASTVRRHVPPNAEEHDAWLRIGARQKADSIVQLTHDRHVRTVLEIGAGSGAVLAELGRRGFAERYYACEPSPALFEQLERQSISQLHEAYPMRLEESPLGQRQFDLAVLSHVLEHVPAPAELLLETLAVASLVLVEVPLDGNLAGNLRATIRTAASGEPRWRNPAGHIHFWSQRDVLALVDASGGRILRRRRYFPSTGYGATAKDPGRKLVLLASRLVPERLFSRLYHGHLALLVERAEPLDTRHPFYA